MSDRFTGDWLVSEYVHNADGSFAGVIKQRRKLQSLGDGRTRVIQQCAPGAELNGHPMAAFAGEWVFELTRDGRARRYHGADVVGMGLAWGENCITGRGVWPRFGHNFTSFGVLVSPERQITGGKFYNAGEMIANIVGVAVPETVDAPDAFPILEGSYWPGDVATKWQGKQSIFDDAGVKTDATIERVYETDSWTETVHVADQTLVTKTQLKPLDGRLLVERSFCRDGEEKMGGVGIGKRNGWLLDIETHTPEDHSTRIDIMDGAGGYLVSIDHAWSQNSYLVRVGFAVMTAS